MDGTAVFLMRFMRNVMTLFLIVVVSSCAPGSMSSKNISPENSNTPEGGLETADSASVLPGDTALSGDSVLPGDSASTTQAAASRVLTSPESNNLGIELVEGKDLSQLVLTSKAKASDISVNRLSSPDRLVIDIKGQQGISSRSFDTSDTEYINRIRVGSHPDMARVVLDLVGGRNIEHAVDSQDGKLVVSLNGANPESPQIVEAGNLDSASSATVDSNPVEVKVDPTLPEPQALLVNDEGDVKAAPKLETESDLAPVRAPSSLENLAIEQIGPNSNMLVADVLSPGNYSLEKTAPSEYVLKISDAKIGANVTPSVAPPSSGIIRSVRAAAQGNDILVRIFAQPGSKLSARSNEDRIVVSAASESDVRAQIAPEKAEDKPKEPEKKTEAAPAAAPAASGKPVEVSLGADSGPSELEKELDQLAANKYSGRKISLDLQDTDIDNALRIIAEVSNLNIIASDDVTGKVTLRLVDVPWDQALDVILKTNGLDSVREGNVIRIAPLEKLRQERDAVKQLKQQAEDLEPLQVKYIRISYAKASELKPLVETVISERGVVTYDERSNQLIIKDIGAGLRNVSELVSRVDLRTPQVLLETQIVEASRSLARDLGSELGFQYVQSPETGNSTGKNFPNTINFGGSVAGTDGGVSSFPSRGDATGGSAISLLLGSADGSKNLDFRITSLESEGRIRVVSRPAVATTNNKQATIKSVEKIRVKTPQGGLSVATGQGASASGSSAVATEAIEIGITLQVTPQASPDYYVLLDINAKSSNFGSHPVDGIPSELERSATSTVLVSSGQTFAMGGIYKITDIDTLEGVPFLKDIPVLGHLFRRASINDSDEELLFFITPRIVEGSFDDATMKVSS